MKEGEAVELAGFTPEERAQFRAFLTRHYRNLTAQGKEEERP